MIICNKIICKCRNIQGLQRLTLMLYIVMSSGNTDFRDDFGSDTRQVLESFRCGSASRRTATHVIDSGLLLKQFPGWDERWT